jgi:hypothetical protein
MRVVRNVSKKDRAIHLADSQVFSSFLYRTNEESPVQSPQTDAIPCSCLFQGEPVKAKMASYVQVRSNQIRRIKLTYLHCRI